MSRSRPKVDVGAALAITGRSSAAVRRCHPGDLKGSTSCLNRRPIGASRRRLTRLKRRRDTNRDAIGIAMTGATLGNAATTADGARVPLRAERRPQPSP
jgi:hypothetical protein